MRALGWGSPDAVLRCRYKSILAMVQGKSTTMIAAGGLCSSSQVYRAALRFLGQGLAGLPNRAEDNGENKVTETTNGRRRRRNELEDLTHSNSTF